MKTLSRILLMAFVFSLFGCGQSDKGLMALIAERDSIKQVNDEQTRRLTRINAMLETVNSTVDSIVAKEGLLFVNVQGDVPLTRADVLNNLENYERLLKHQSEKLDRLQKEMERADESESTSGLVSMLRNEIAVKDAMIAKLKEELKHKDVNIAQLRNQLASQNSIIQRHEETIAGLNQVNRIQTVALARQDEALNFCYVLVGTKKDLERKGVVKKGKLLSDGALDRSKFAKVDIRKYLELPFSAKKPRILTNMPQQSYTLTKVGKKEFVLKINNPSDFWRISNYLVIQTD